MTNRNNGKVHTSRAWNRFKYLIDFFMWTQSPCLQQNKHVDPMKIDVMTVTSKSYKTARYHSLVLATIYSFVYGDITFRFLSMFFWDCKSIFKTTQVKGWIVPSRYLKCIMLRKILCHMIVFSILLFCNTLHRTIPVWGVLSFCSVLYLPQDLVGGWKYEPWHDPIHINLNLTKDPSI
jgi:Ni/Fe-hydrogenase subunit HybB-like protein